MIFNVNAHGNQTGSMVTLWGGKLGKKDSHADIGNHSNVVINVCKPSWKALFFFFAFDGNFLALAGDTPASTSSSSSQSSQHLFWLI